MIFADLSNGELVFIDANTYVYHFGPDPVFGTACHEFLERIERQEIRGFTSTHVLTEVAHRLMTIEAMSTFGWPVGGIASRLRRHPKEVQKLTQFRSAIESIVMSKVEVAAISPPMVSQAAALSQQWGLLSSDAMIVAVMQTNGLVNLASNDSDFDGVAGIVRLAPL
jgi:predicted nucleic acid-binding protein